MTGREDRQTGVLLSFLSAVTKSLWVALQSPWQCSPAVHHEFAELDIKEDQMIVWIIILVVSPIFIGQLTLLSFSVP